MMPQNFLRHYSYTSPFCSTTNPSSEKLHQVEGSFFAQPRCQRAG